MKKWVFFLMRVFIALGATVESQETAPRKLVQTITLPPDVKRHCTKDRGKKERLGSNRWSGRWV